MPRLPLPLRPTSPSFRDQRAHITGPFRVARADHAGRAASSPCGAEARGQEKLRAGLGGGWTQGPADQTARLSNLQPVSLDRSGAELGLSRPLPTWRLLPAHRVRTAPGPLDLRFSVLALPSAPSLCCLLHSGLLLGGVDNLPALLPIPGGTEPTLEPEAGPGPAPISLVSFRGRRVGAGERGVRDSGLLRKGDTPQLLEPPLSQVPNSHRPPPGTALRPLWGPGFLGLA